MERKRSKPTRVERGRKQRVAEWIRLAWWAVGFALVLVFMLHNDLMNVTGVLAVLGVSEAVAKGWKWLGDKVGAEREGEDKE